MYRRVSVLFRFIVIIIWLFCFSVRVVGSWRLVVANSIQASVQLTSSSLSVNDLLSGGSAVSQDMQQIRSRAMMKNKKFNCEFKFFPY